MDAVPLVQDDHLVVEVIPVQGRIPVDHAPTLRLLDHIQAPVIKLQLVVTKRPQVPVAATAAQRDIKQQVHLLRVVIPQVKDIKA